MTALIEARHVSKVFGDKLFDHSNALVAVDDLSLKIEESPPTITAIVGESGSGKTTFARLILGLTDPTEGQVLYRGADMCKLDRTQRLQFLRDIQVIFQDPYEVYNPFYRVDHVLQSAIKNFDLAESRAEGRALIEDALVNVGLRPEETLGRFPHQLSGGQRQRLMVARALLLRPRVIIADEPVSMIDASLRATITESLKDLNQRFGISLIYITHDLTTAYQISENIIVLYRGGVAEAGDVERVVHQPEHPYTRLLISSIPQANPDRAWGQEEDILYTTSDKNKGRQGCLFADRCPHAMPVCRKETPPLYQTAPHRATACHLYQESSAATLESLDEIFVSRS